MPLASRFWTCPAIPGGAVPISSRRPNANTCLRTREILWVMPPLAHSAQAGARLVSQPPTPDRGSLSVMGVNVTQGTVFPAKLGQWKTQIRTKASELGQSPTTGWERSVNRERKVDVVPAPHL